MFFALQLLDDEHDDDDDDNKDDRDAKAEAGK